MDEKYIYMLQRIYETFNLKIENYNILKMIEFIGYKLPSYNSKLNDILLLYDAINKKINDEKIISYIFLRYFEIINKKIDKCTDLKTQEYINIITKINLEMFQNINELLKDKKNINCTKINLDLKPVESIIPQYTGYAFRTESNVSIESAYELSILNKIEEYAVGIFNLIKIINNKNSNFIEVTEDTLDLALNIKNIMCNEEGFQSIINLFFKAIYENSGVECNRIYALNDCKVSEFLDIIKNIRACFDHSKSKMNKNRIKKMYKYIKEKIGIEYPITRKDWVNLQCSLYKDLIDTLKRINDII